MTHYKQLAAVAAAFIVGAVAMNFISTARSQSAGNTGGAANADSGPRGFAPAEFPVLRKRLWVIQTTAVGDGSRSLLFVKDHLLHQIELEKTGVMFGAGPVKEVGGNSVFGLIIVRADSAEEARRIADSDPMHINKARTYKLYEWSLNEGTIGVRINFSQGTFKFD